MRTLTEKENQKIKSYNLPFLIEQKVRHIWGNSPEPQKLSIIEISACIIGATIIFGSLIIIWLNYFMPNIHQLKTWMNVVAIFCCFIMPAISIFALLQVISVNQNDNEAFKRYTLDAWKKGIQWKRILSRTYFILIILGFFLNDDFIFIVAGLITGLCFLFNLFLNLKIRKNVQEIMNKTNASK